MRCFALRFRHREEDEGRGSLFFEFSTAADNVARHVRHVMHDIMRDYPSVLFDGMIYFASHD